MMGHLSSGYVTEILPQVKVLAKYDVNIYSYESDLTAGLEFQNNHQKSWLKSVLFKIGLGKVKTSNA